MTRCQPIGLLEDLGDGWYIRHENLGAGTWYVASYEPNPEICQS